VLVVLVVIATHARAWSAIGRFFTIIGAAPG
jgi:hypothetical protein